MSAVISVLISLTAIVSEILELSMRNNILRRLTPKGQSQNVIGVIPPQGEHKQDLLLVGHVESHRTPIIFSTQGWLTIFSIFVPVAFIAFLVQTTLFILGAVIGWKWIWPASSVGAIFAILLLALSIHADLTPFSPGANDNASGVGLVLALGEQLATQPLKNTRLYLVCTGCEETQHNGASDFFARHREEFKNPVALIFDMVGCSGPSWVNKEGILVNFRADSQLTALAERIAKEHPEWNAYPVQISGGITEMTDAMLAGVPAITVTGMERHGEKNYWHQRADTYDKMNLTAMENTFAFVKELIMALDGENGE